MPRNLLSFVGLLVSVPVGFALAVALAETLARADVCNNTVSTKEFCDIGGALQCEQYTTNPPCANSIGTYAQENYWTKSGLGGWHTTLKEKGEACAEIWSCTWDGFKCTFKARTGTKTQQPYLTVACN